MIFKEIHIKLTLFVMLSCMGMSGVRVYAQEGLTLDSCLSLAIVNSTQVRNAQIEVEMAQQTRNAARTKYFPQISASAMHFSALKPFVELGIDDIQNAALRDLLHTLYYQNPLLLQGVGKNLEMFQNGNVVSVMALQPIYAGGRIITGNALAKVGVDAMQLQTELAENNVLLSTEESYWQIISLKEKRKVLGTVKDLLDRANKDVSNAVKAGLTTKNDLLQVKLKQNEINSALLALNNGVQLATMALCQAIGIEYADTLELTDTLMSEAVSPLEYYVPTEQITAGRTEVKLLDAAVKVEELQYKMILGEALPQIAIGGGYMFNDLLFNKQSSNGMLFASMQIPLTSWWETGYNLKKQRLKQEQAENNRRDITEKLRLQAQQIWDELELSYEQVMLAEENTDFAKENSELAQINYKAGMVSMTELMQAQTLLIQALDQETDKKIAYRVKLVHYRQLVGGDI